MSRRAPASHLFFRACVFYPVIPAKSPSSVRAFSSRHRNVTFFFHTPPPQPPNERYLSVSPFYQASSMQCPRDLLSVPPCSEPCPLPLPHPLEFYVTVSYPAFSSSPTCLGPQISHSPATRLPVCLSAYFNAILPNHLTLSLSHRVQKTVLYISVSFSVSIQGYCYHVSTFHIYALVYCIGVFLSGLDKTVADPWLHSVSGKYQGVVETVAIWKPPALSKGEVSLQSQLIVA